MTKGDKFLWLAVESSNQFGELCEVTEIMGDKLQYRFVAHPDWKSGIMPIEMTKKDYSPEQISEIRIRWKRKRRLGRDC